MPLAPRIARINQGAVAADAVRGARRIPAKRGAGKRSYRRIPKDRSTNGPPELALRSNGLVPIAQLRELESPRPRRSSSQHSRTRVRSETRARSWTRKRRRRRRRRRLLISRTRNARASWTSFSREFTAIIYRAPLMNPCASPRLSEEETIRYRTR